MVRSCFGSWLAIVLLALVVPARAARAQSGGPTRGAPPVAEAVPRAGAVATDGKLDEEAWQRAKPITEFRQYEPREGEPASLPTEVRVLYDDEAIYIGARMVQPAGVVAPLARRDQLLDSEGDNSLTTDRLTIELDAYHNHLDAAEFEINPAGVKGDQFNGDASWDPIWQAAAQVDSLGWTAEMRIPYSQLRFSRDSAQTWGMQIWRHIDRLHEHDMWAFWRRDQSGGAAFFGNLSGLVIASRPRQLELLPYAVTGSTFKDVPADDPYHGRRSTRYAVGGDIKYLLTSNLTLDATLNPDFGQVEVDPASLNLSAFETYYDEKRPFFIAGASSFDFGGMSCLFCSNASGLDAFYSRRIGRPPQLNGYLGDIASYADAPDNTAILGAAKITGRTRQGYSVGLLDAVTSRERARFLPRGGASERSQVVEPLSNYFVGRLKKEFRDGNTTVGAILTSVERETGDTVVDNRLRGHAQAAGLDWRHNWQRRDYSWTGSVLFSNVAGSAAAIGSTQRSSAHYFQRPDRHVGGNGLFGTRYDTTATTLQGYGLFTRVAKTGGSWLWEGMANVRSPGFEVNDLAFLERADYGWFNGNIARQWMRPTRWYREMVALAGGSTQYNFDGDRTLTELQSLYGLTLPNYWHVQAMNILNLPSYDDRRLRGGPVVRRHGYDVAELDLSTDARRPVVFDFEIQPAWGVGARTWSLVLEPGVAFKPASNIFLELEPRYARDEDPIQYVTAVQDPTAGAFAGTRYVFGHIETKTVSLETRVQWTFTPALTLQLFAQPFIASGRYWDFREFAGPRRKETLLYGRDLGTISYDAGGARYRVDPDGAGPARPFSFDNPDFTSRALRGTAVLRWEYRPGSTLYFVWTQERAGDDPNARVDLAMARDAMFRDRPVNVFQVKATYWIGR